MRSLRFRLPALFLAGIVAAGFVSVAIAFQLLSNYSRSQSLKELRREASGLNALISQQATDVIDLGQSAPAIEPGQLEKDPATPDKVIAAALKHGVASRVLRGHAVHISPPFVITEDQIDQMVDGIGNALEDVAAVGVPA